MNRLRKVYRNMRGRCEYPGNPKWRIYGGRGITVCDRWKSFANFMEDMGFPEPGQSLDRIDNDKGYSKENCRWADRLTQTRNRRCTRTVNFDGREMTISECASRAGLPYHVLASRIRNGWEIERAVSTPRSPVRLRLKSRATEGAGGQA